MAKGKSKFDPLERLQIKEFWANLSPSHRRIAAIVLVAASTFLVLGLLTGGEENSSRTRLETIKRSVLTDTNTREKGIDALSAQIQRMKDEQFEKNKEMERLQEEILQIQKRRGNDPDLTKELQIVKSQLKQIQTRAESLGWKMEDIEDGYYAVPGSDKGPSEKRKTLVEAKKNAPEIQAPLAPALVDVEEGLESDPNYHFRTAPIRPAQPAPSAGAPNLKSGAQSGGGLNIVTIESQSISESETVEEEPIYIPSGSIISGVMLNGLDAPTGRNARKDPFPVLVRIQREAVLPNYFQADVKECFATLAGYGDLSSERAFLRGESFSCIKNNGDAIEVQFPAYAVGEDGKAGVRGRLVTKAGALIAKTALAGFAAGVAEAFDSSPVPVIQTGDAGSSRVYQDNFGSGATQHGASSGASAALTKLADYYMDMADEMFPVVEVDAGRSVDIIVTTGFKLKIRSENTKLAKKD
jgi:conjugal transfer pilus assembly protein TraB